MRYGRADYERIQDPAGLIPEDEPVFLIRAKDMLALAVVTFWANEAEAWGAAEDIVRAAREQAHRMELWQESHGSKIPDLPTED